MNELLHARVKHLEGQLEHYTNVVQRQQQALHDVYQLLDDAIPGSSSGRMGGNTLSKLKSCVGAALEAAARQPSSSSNYGAASATGGWSPAKANQLQDDMNSFQQHATRNAPQPSVESLIPVGRRIHHTVRRLLAVWLEHMSKKVERLLEEPREKFQCFHDFPSEDTLSGFMDAFVASSTQVSDLMRVAMEECNEDATAVDRAATSSGVVTGNPFGRSQDADRLVRLFAETISDSAVVAESSRDDESSSTCDESECAPGPQLTGTQKPVHAVGYGGVEEAPILPRAAVGVANNENFHPQPQHQQHERRASSPPAPGKRRPPLPQSLPQSNRDLPHNSVPRLQPQNTESHPPTPRGVPSRRTNDSSQMWTAMGTDALRPPTGGTPTSSNGRRVDDDKLSQLHAVLQQLEFQLAGVAMAGRNSGSEAKYYALSKKLQKVRADIVREQRVVEEVRQSEKERALLRQEKEVHRRTFHR